MIPDSLVVRVSEEPLLAAQPKIKLNKWFFEHGPGYKYCWRACLFQYIDVNLCIHAVLVLYLGQSTIVNEEKTNLVCKKDSVCFWIKYNWHNNSAPETSSSHHAIAITCACVCAYSVLYAGILSTQWPLECRSCCPHMRRARAQHCSSIFSCTSLSSCRPRSPSVPVHTHTHVSPVYPYRVTCRSGYPSQVSRYHPGASTSPLTLLSSPPPPCCSCRLVWDARSSFTIDCDRLIIHRLPDVTHKPKPPTLEYS